MDRSDLIKNIQDFLDLLGFHGEHFKDTPRRIADYWEDRFKLLAENETKLQTGIFLSQDDLVVLANIEINGICSHHLQPFWGKAYVSYISTGKMLGLSKLARIVKKHAAMPTVQEKITFSVAADVKALAETPHVAVITEALHSCVWLRGVHSKSPAIVSTMLGYFREREHVRREFMELIAPYRTKT